MKVQSGQLPVAGPYVTRKENGRTSSVNLQHLRLLPVPGNPHTLHLNLNPHAKSEFC